MTVFGVRIIRHPEQQPTGSSRIMSLLHKLTLSEAEVYVDVCLTADAKQFSSRHTSTIALDDDGCGRWNNDQGERVSFDMLFNAGESGMASRILLVVSDFSKDTFALSPD
eukprot:SAG31_NODE_58_length_29669_cov_20.244978_2_plen_110_part_00